MVLAIDIGSKFTIISLLCLTIALSNTMGAACGAGTVSKLTLGSLLCLTMVWWVPHVKQERHVLPEHPSSPPVFSGLCVARSLVFCVMFCRPLFVFWSFFCWPLYCLSFDLQFLIITLVCFGHCIVSPLIYSFSLLLWYLLTIVLSLLWFTVSHYHFGIFKLCLCNIKYSIGD